MLFTELNDYIKWFKKLIASGLSMTCGQYVIFRDLI
jgi:hypothetical protein